LRVCRRSPDGAAATVPSPSQVSPTRALPIRVLDDPPPCIFDAQCVKMGLAHTRGPLMPRQLSLAVQPLTAATIAQRFTRTQEFARSELSLRTRLHRSNTLPRLKVLLNTRRESRKGLHTPRLLTPMRLPPTQHYIGIEAYDPRYPPHGRPYADATTSSTRAAKKGRRHARHARVRTLSARKSPPLRACHSTCRGFAHGILLPFAHPQAVAAPTGIAQTQHHSGTATVNPRLLPA
jgi:hypothetical protein